MSTDFLPYGRHWVDEDDIAAVVNCLRGDWLTTGPAVAEFEAAFAETVGARFAVVCANGTAALHLAALAGGVSAGDTCIAPTMSFAASANGMRYAGGEIAFADADPSTGLITAESFSQAIERASKPVKMAVVVHLNGQTVDIEAISSIAASKGIILVEDACHALGGRHVDADGESHPVGSCRHSAMTVFSLHPVKTITMGEGGVVTTNDAGLYDRLKLLRSHGLVRDPDRFLMTDMAYDAKGSLAPWYYEMQELGYNYRASDFACVLAHSQLKKLPMFAARRQQVREVYDRHFGDLGEAVRPVVLAAPGEAVLHLYPLLIDFPSFKKSRVEVMVQLREKGIGTQVHYIPIHKQPYYAKLAASDGLDGAETYYERVLSIPYYPLMDKGDAERVGSAVKQVLDSNS